ncbi:hypothetical protein C8Q80DRAFT_239807 [Daedaleopsis nitida]|nr:hypothetical protein C8Q80DRAFT_239807 [Daedaleopsis nitida]
MELEELPGDILRALAEHLSSIHDYRSFLLASPAFHHAVPRLSSRVLAMLASRPGSKDIQPFTLTALALKGRLVAEWATQSAANRNTLLAALKEGQLGLLKLAFALFPFTPSDIVSIRHIHKTVLLPAARYLRACPDMSFTRRTIGSTIIPRPFTSLQKLIYYCITAYWAYSELFHHQLTCRLHPDAAIEPLSVETRQEWISAFVYIEPPFKPSCACPCKPAHERELAQEYNECREMLHRSSCLMLSLTFQQCFLVIADEILTRFEDLPDNPSFADLEWAALYDASGALRMQGLETLKWLLATKGTRVRSPWPKTIVDTILAAREARLTMQEWNILDADLQHHADSLHYPEPDLDEL